MSPSSSHLPPEAAAALARGDVVGAVKHVRQATGLGLKEAHDLVQAHAKAQAAGTGPGPTQAGGFAFPPAAAAAVARGEFVNAIALLRQANPHLDLKTAKEAVDHVRRGAAPVEGALKPGVRPNQPPRVPTVVAGDRGSRGWLTVMLVVVFAMLLLWLLDGA
jgi:hypothetical protein